MFPIDRMNISLGKDSITGNDFSIDTTKHINIEGMSGMGKSTMLVNLFVEYIRQGNGASNHTVADYSPSAVSLAM
jgi:ABC-type transport system involved in cytochrome bd biosynthesis fused ATPase/permease subunit